MAVTIFPIQVYKESYGQYVVVHKFPQHARETLQSRYKRQQAKQSSSKVAFAVDNSTRQSNALELYSITSTMALSGVLFAAVVGALCVCTTAYPTDSAAAEKLQDYFADAEFMNEIQPDFPAEMMNEDDDFPEADEQALSWPKTGVWFYCRTPTRCVRYRRPIRPRTSELAVQQSDFGEVQQVEDEPPVEGADTQFVTFVKRCYGYGWYRRCFNVPELRKP